MTKLADGGTKSWDDGLLGRLQAFVNVWRNFEGSELAGAQEFLKSLVEIYDVSYRPGTIFEQHPIKVPAHRPKAAQVTLFGEQEKVKYTTARMDLYLRSSGLPSSTGKPCGGPVHSSTFPIPSRHG